MAHAPEVPDVRHQLAESPLFKGVDAVTLARIIGLGHLRHKSAGECYFTEGRPADEFFVLTTGRVKLTQVTAEGNQVVLRLIAPGDIFGGAGAFGDPAYPTSAEAVEPSTARAWTSTVMRHVLETEPGVTLNAVHVIAGQLYDLQRRYRQLMTERVDRRVARALLRLVREAGRRVDEGVEIDFAISRQDIAEMTGTTLYTVSRLISAWEDRGILSGGRQHIVLLNADALVAIAQDASR
jgi:CRP/FNR family transcriptional regulator, nitrogen oxide reductase regulator